MREAARRAGALYAGLAFGPAAWAYDRLTGHEGWRTSCRALAALVEGPRVLDLGVGPGEGALAAAGAAPGRRLTGVDRSLAMLRRAARAARRAGAPLALVQADAVRLPFRGGALDGVTAHSVLYLLPDPAAALAEVRRVLRAGGRVAVLEPHRAWPGVRRLLGGGPREAAALALWRTMSRLHRRFEAEELAGLLTAAGFARARAWPVRRGWALMACAEKEGSGS